MIFPSEAQYKKVNFIPYGEKDGLPGSEVHDVLIDKLGYVWTGTVNGLVRYDGYEFKRFYYNPNDTGSIRGLIVWSLFEDRKSNIWIGSSPMFLNRYEAGTQTFHPYEFANLISHSANVELIIRCMEQDNNGRIYFGIDTYYGNPINSAILYKNENEDQVKALSMPAGVNVNNVYRLRKDNKGNVWVFAYNGIFKIDKQGGLSAFTLLNKEFGAAGDYPADIVCTKDGHLWVLSQRSGLIDLDPESGSYTKWFSHELYVSAENNYAPKIITLDKAENIWLGTNGGLQFFNRTTKQFSMIIDPAKKELDHANLSSLKVDGFGTLWIGSFSNGLIKYEEKSSLRSFSYSQDDKRSITGGWANFIYESADGRLWVATNGSNAGISIYDPGSGSIHPFPYSSIAPLVNGVNCIWENVPGEIYFGSYGIYKFSEKKRQLEYIKMQGLPDSIYTTYYYKDTRSNEWICTAKGLYKKSKGADHFTKFDPGALEGNNVSSSEVIRCFESKKYGLWLITNNGLFLYDYVSDKIQRHGFDKKTGDIFLTQDINSFYEDDNGIVWVGTWQGGLSRYNVETKKIKTYTRNDGLPSMSIQSILKDEKNNCLWLSTFEGLSRFNIKTEQFNNFSITDGIQSQLFADGSFLKTSNNFFVFGGSNGITIFNPDEINKNSIPPKVFLTDLKIFNRSVIPGESSILKNPIYETDSIALTHSQNNLSFEFTALQYSNSSKNKFSYKLENYDNEWRDVGSQRTAFYPSLPPGKYTFRVKAANDKGVWNEQGASLRIIVSPPWWRTTGAYVGYTLILIALGFAVDRYVRRRIVRKEREKARIRELDQAREIEKAYHKLEQTHEALKSTQSQLIQSEKMASLGELTAGIAHEIQNPLNFVNNFSEINRELVEELDGAVKSGNIKDAIAISKSIKDNEEKITYHGKRADAIVKGMLQHSRANTGQKELTDINTLADEYLRLAYHGLRAKDKSFNAKIETDFDHSIGKINVVPQDIGRVLLNLYNNAFYAVSEKKKSAFTYAKASGDKSANATMDSYEPTVSISTKMLDDKLTIKVKDNGNGIPPNIVDKIFQPFFTTKPKGEVTGLG